MCTTQVFWKRVPIVLSIGITAALAGGCDRVAGELGPVPKVVSCTWDTHFLTSDPYATVRVQNIGKPGQVFISISLSLADVKSRNFVVWKNNKAGELRAEWINRVAAEHAQNDDRLQIGWASVGLAQGETRELTIDLLGCQLDKPTSIYCKVMPWEAASKTQQGLALRLD